MSYYCKKCNEIHPGWPPLYFKMPIEAIGKKVKQINRVETIPNYIVITHRDHDHHYIRVIWEQKIKGSSEPWILYPWVMIRPQDYEGVLDNRKKKIGVRLHNQFPWYKGNIINLPLTIEHQYNDLYKVISIDAPIQLIIDDFTNGLSQDLAQMHVDLITENCEIDCGANPFESRLN